MCLRRSRLLPPCATILAFVFLSVTNDPIAKVATAQEAVSSPARRFEPTRWNVEERISAVENGLIAHPFIIDGEPPKVQSLHSLMAASHVPGLSVAVIDNHKIAWAKGYGVTDVRTGTQVTPHTLFNAGGITKLVTAVAIVKLAAAGRIDLDADVRNMLRTWQPPSNQFSVNQPITLRELLSHTSGFNEHFPGSYSPGTAMPTLIQQLNGVPPSRSGPVTVTHIPGSTFEYSSGGYLVVQSVVTDVMREPFAEVVRRLVLVPLGMTNSTFVQPNSDRPDPERATGHVRDSTGIRVARTVSYPELASSGLWTTPTDLAKLVIALQGGARSGGFIPDPYFRQIITPVTNNVGLGVFMAGRGPSMRFRVRGSDGVSNDEFVAWLVGYVHSGQGAVIMSNCNDLAPGFDLLRSIAQQYGWPEYIQHRKLYPVDAAQLDRYVGVYSIAGDEVTFSRDGDRLYCQIDGSAKFQLLATSSTDFFLNMDMFHEAVVHFVMGKNGVATEVDMNYPQWNYRGQRLAGK